jgi:hypothetical protein
VSHPVRSHERRVSPGRVVLVGLGLIPVGGVAGGLAGALGATIWLAAVHGMRAAFDLQMWAFAGVVGFVLGAALLPVAGLTALRRVPLGRALIETILATALGGAIGMQMTAGWWLAGALGGFGLAVARLWLRARRSA